jgi:hypothetical protein
MGLDDRVKPLGFPSYTDYLRSRHWRQMKVAFRESAHAQECICGETEDLHLHHKTYARLGAERLDDLVALCSRCHRMVHVLARRGLLRYDLRDFTSDERAAEYAHSRLEPPPPDPTALARRLVRIRRLAEQHGVSLKRENLMLKDGRSPQRHARIVRRMEQKVLGQ